MAKTEILTLRIDELKKYKLQLLADRESRSVSNYVLLLIDFAISGSEDTTAESNYVRNDKRSKIAVGVEKPKDGNIYTNKQSEILKELGIKINL